MTMVTGIEIPPNGAAPVGADRGIEQAPSTHTSRLPTKNYTLGNVLSASAGNERSLADGALSLSSSANNLDSVAQIYQGRQLTDSSISLQMNNEEDTSVIYGNVVQAICGIASACKDTNITALAQPMLLQNIDKINSTVDAKIIPAAAVLALSGGQLAQVNLGPPKFRPA